MLPFDYVCVDELPLSANGKLNRKALPDYQVQSIAYEAPRNSTDEHLIAICEELLGVQKGSEQKKIGIADNFFALGGHSLLATRLIMQIRLQFGIDLPLKTIFEVSDLKSLSNLISALSPMDHVSNYPLDDSSYSSDEEYEESGLLDDDFEEGVL